MMAVLNKHLPGKLVDVPLPQSEWQVRVAAGVAGRGNTQTQLVATCPKCDFVFDVPGVLECMKCRLALRKRGQRKMIVGDVGARIKKLYSIRNMAHNFEYSLTRVPGDGDCWDGSEMHSITEGILSLIVVYVSLYFLVMFVFVSLYIDLD